MYVIQLIMQNWEAALCQAIVCFQKIKVPKTKIENKPYLCPPF
jgi:hypothetical protein